MCECNCQLKRMFRSANRFSAYLSSDQEAVPVQWTEKELVACMRCGEYVGRIPEDALKILREGAGESAA